MAKVAGRKNEGAWQRFNNWLENDMSPDEAAALEDALEAQANIQSCYTLIKTTYTGYGIPLPTQLASITGWLATMVDNGFPLDVYMGKVSYDLYEKDTSGPKTIYTPILGPSVAAMGVDVRAISKLYIFADRQLGWFAKDTHPVPAAVRATKKGSPERAAFKAARREQINAIRAARVEAKTPLALPPMPQARKKALTARANKI